MSDNDNLPPGVTESMLPGNTPEDQEVEIVLVLNQWMVDKIVEFIAQRKGVKDSGLNNFY